jgi:hypothetical protein
VADLGADWSSLSELTTEETIERMFFQGDAWVGIGTARDFTVPVTIRVLKEQPASPPPDVDRTNDGRLDVASGIITVFGPSEYRPDHRRMPITPGSYRVRALYRNLDRVDPMGIEGEDAYEVQLWLDPARVTFADPD